MLDSAVPIRISPLNRRHIRKYLNMPIIGPADGLVTVSVKETNCGDTNLVTLPLYLKRSHSGRVMLFSEQSR